MFKTTKERLELPDLELHFFKICVTDWFYTLFSADSSDFLANQIDVIFKRSIVRLDCSCGTHVTIPGVTIIRKSPLFIRTYDNL